MNKVIRPQGGKQELFLSCSEDIVIYGGAAGGGKTYALLLEALHDIQTPGFYGVYLRNSFPQIMAPGGLWDTAREIYQHLPDVHYNKTHKTIEFRKWGSRLEFSYLERDDQVNNWQGSQIALICFDELTHFSKKMFFELLARNRSVSGVKPRVRATCNPDPDSWLREFLDSYINKEGYIKEEECDKVKYFVNSDDVVHWYANKDTARSEFPNIIPKSFKFIKSDVYDNKILIDTNPEYISNLQSAGRVGKARFLEGNWDVRAGKGDYFAREDFDCIDEVPEIVLKVRAWDFAASIKAEKGLDPDYTVGILCGLGKDGHIYVLDMYRGRVHPGKCEDIVTNTAKMDGRGTHIYIPTDPGQAGIGQIRRYTHLLMGYPFKSDRVTGSKETRAKGASAQVKANNVTMVKAGWNLAFLNELENFPEAGHDDIVDAFSDAITQISVLTRSTTRVIPKPRGVI